MKDDKGMIKLCIILLLLAFGIGLLISGITDLIQCDTEYTALKEAGMIPGPLMQHEKGIVGITTAIVVLTFGFLINNQSEKTEATEDTGDNSDEKNNGGMA